MEIHHEPHNPNTPKPNYLSKLNKSLEEAPLLINLSKPRMHGFDLSMNQVHTMGCLQRVPGGTMTKLANYLSISTAAMTGLVDKLERLELIVRVQSQKDRRTIEVRLTERGEQTILEYLA